MEINYFDFPSVSIVPYKTNAPLVVDANAVLVTPVSRQSFQTVPRRHSQVVEVSGSVQHIQFHPRPTLYGFGKPCHPAALGYCPGISVAVISNHPRNISYLRFP